MPRVSCLLAKCSYRTKHAKSITFVGQVLVQDRHRVGPDCTTGAGCGVGSVVCANREYWWGYRGGATTYVQRTGQLWCECSTLHAGPLSRLCRGPVCLYDAIRVHAEHTPLPPRTREGRHCAVPYRFVLLRLRQVQAHWPSCPYVIARQPVAVALF